ncbi:MAG: DUF928 domain-containing protein [Nitrospira sp.]|nr:DUF928 domain-containing protein [Nitrospira sp.]MBX3340040.1 DUF928 domain-containing protein [Nitrospira sp.]MBX3371183.1 DUF928 domain-containing protein [Nitrospira sp.]MBX7037990.1 DUF928 domain-containing protein [Nitrospira sp.]MCW5793060.1 DUF928 domain-containing protein [Nitrospira sp.]
MARTFVATLLFTVSLVSTNAAAPEGVPDVPQYNAPQKMTPRARLGGSLRGSEGEDPAVAALVPDHVGITVKQHPALNWFLSKHTSLPITFTLIDERSIHALVERPLAPPHQAGVHAVKLEDLGVTLQPNIQYRWYISVIKDADSPSQDIVTGGMIERCEFSECSILGAMTTCTREAVMTSAAKGFWYDAMGCLCDLIDSNPADTALRKQRAALLRQVGLHDVADWDLAQSHARQG